MNRIGVAVVALIALMVLNSCVTMSADECLTGDWQAVGFEDGVQGYDAERLGDHRRACAEHGVTPDFQAYQRGRAQGLEQYCQPSRGFNMGADGDSYNGICANHRERDFLDAFNSGQQLFRLRAELDTIESEIHNIEQEINRNDELIVTNQELLLADETSTEQRVLILSRLEELSESNGYLGAEIQQLLADVSIQERRILDYETAMANSGF